jgi:hypothetical protein
LLLQRVGFDAPSEPAIGEAMEANNAFIARIEAIRDKYQTLSIEHG